MVHSFVVPIIAALTSYLVGYVHGIKGYKKPVPMPILVTNKIVQDESHKVCPYCNTTVAKFSYDKWNRVICANCITDPTVMKLLNG